MIKPRRLILEFAYLAQKRSPIAIVFFTFMIRTLPQDDMRARVSFILKCLEGYYDTDLCLLHKALILLQLFCAIAAFARQVLNQRTWGVCHDCCDAVQLESILPVLRPVQDVHQHWHAMLLCGILHV